MSDARLGDELYRPVNRRTLLRLLGAGAGAGVLGGLLAACGGSSSEPTATTKPAGGSSSGGTTPATSGAATQAPASSGGGTTPAASGSPSGAASGGKAGGTLVVAANFSIQNGLDPARQLETTSNMINHAAYDSLVTFKGEDLQEPLPSLAASWEVSTDALTYTFKLRQNVKFQVSGNPMTSADVKWSLDRLKNFKGNPAFLVDAVSEVQAPSADSAVLKLTKAFSGMIACLSSSSTGIIDSKLVSTKGGVADASAKENDKADQYLNSASAGTGPYMITGYKPDEEIVQERNPNYWGDKPFFDRIVTRNITEAAAQKAQVEGGDIDIATGLTQDQLPALKNSKGVVAKTAPTAAVFYVLLNNNAQVGGPFANPKIQQAVRYALDYAGILKLAGEGAVVLASPMPAIFPGSLPAGDAFKQDKDKAKALIQEANLGEISGAISFGSDSVTLGIQHALLAQKVQADLAAVGMKVTLDALPRAAALQKYRDAKNQIGVWTWVADWPDASNYMVYLPGRTVGLRAGWSADASDDAKALAAQGAQAEADPDPKKRVGLFQDVERKLMQIGPYAPLFQPAAPYAYRDNLTGVSFHSVWGVDYNAVKRT